jgi:hypothetical protein
MAEARHYVRTEEVLSFVITAGVMLTSSLFFPTYYWVFIFLTVVDGISTAIRNELFVSLDRLSYAFIVLVLGGIALGLAVIPMILETVLVIALIDYLLLIRRIHAPSWSDFFKIILRRAESYLYTLVPAAVFSSGLIYLGALSIGSSFGQANAILELGLASIAVFSIILYLTIRQKNLK